MNAKMGSLTPEIAIVGAGLSGLACARKLARAGVRFTIYESADAVGGRVRTDVLDGDWTVGFKFSYLAIPWRGSSSTMTHWTFVLFSVAQMCFMRGVYDELRIRFITLRRP